MTDNAPQSEDDPAAPEADFNLDELEGDYPEFDRETLPAEFTVDHVKGMTLQDIDWLKDNKQRLTLEQAESYDRAYEEMWAPMRERLRSLTLINRLGNSKLGVVPANKSPAFTAWEKLRHNQTSALSQALAKAQKPTYDIGAVSKALKSQDRANMLAIQGLNSRLNYLGSGQRSRPSAPSDPAATDEVDPAESRVPEVPSEPLERVGDLRLAFEETLDQAAQQVALMTEQGQTLRTQQKTLEAVEALLKQQNRRASDERMFGTVISHVFIATLVVTVASKAEISWMVLTGLAVTSLIVTLGLHGVISRIVKSRRSKLGHAPLPGDGRSDPASMEGGAEERAAKGT